MSSLIVTGAASDGRDPTGTKTDREITRAEFVECYLVEHDLPRAYMRAGKREKGRILDAAAAALGYHRKAVIRLLHRLAKERGTPRQRPGRARVYSPASRHALYEMYRTMDCPGERKLHGSLPEWLGPLQREGEIAFPRSVQKELLRMSASSMGRIVRAHRPRRASTPRRSRPDTRIQADTPIRTWSHWDGVQPGEVQADTVFHAGGIGGEGHLYTIAVVSPYTGWWGACAVGSLAQRHAIPALDELRRRAPFTWTAIHSDNGSGFLNQRAVAWARTHGITRTRGRPRKSGDQAWVENTNRRFVRDLVGDARYAGEEAKRLLDTLYRVAAEIENLFMANRRRIGMKRAGHRTTPIYDQARTPYRRLRESGVLEADVAQKLQLHFETMNPADLMRAREQMRDQLWELRWQGS